MGARSPHTRPLLQGLNSLRTIFILRLFFLINYPSLFVLLRDICSRDAIAIFPSSSNLMSLPPRPPLFFFLFLILFISVSSSPHSCSSTPPHNNSSCPPFIPPPTNFPFSTSPGCNHPSFRIHCSSPHSLLLINSSPFLLLHFHPSPNSFNLTPFIPTSSCASSLHLPTHAINLSSSPFFPSPSPCPLLSNFSHPCAAPPPPPHKKISPFSLNSCNLSSWQLDLLRDPLLLFTSCSSFPRRPCNTSIDPSQRLLNVSRQISTFLTTGFRVEWDLSKDPYNANCSACRRSADGVCGFNDTLPSKPFLCFPSLDRLEKHHRHRSLFLLIAVLAVACVFLVTISLYAASAVRNRWRRKRGESTLMNLFLNRHQIYPPIFSYDQLRSSTDGFDPRRKIGDGGFGSVYLANLDDGRILAVKRLHRQHPNASTKSFCNEIMILSSLRHPNLVRLHGYCFDPRGLLLVYDYVPNGTLADHIHGSRSLYRKAVLTWGVRVEVALQIASALEYLHFSLKPPVVHRDITSSNIFVERDMRIKVGDFGLSRLLSLPDPNSCTTGDSLDEYVCCTGPQGTPGYLDPEYHRSFRLTEKSDVYSFGVVLLELVTGMKAVDMRRDKREVSLADLVVSKIHVGALQQVVDPVLLRQGEGMGTIEAVAELAFRCVAGDKDDRPNARELVEELKRIKGVLQDAASKGS